MTTESLSRADDSSGADRASGADGTSGDEAAAAHAAWRTAVAGVLAKSRRVEPATLGDRPEKLLDTTTYDDLTIAALYTAADELAEAPLPGTAPFVRGRTAARDVVRGWDVAARYGSDAGIGKDAADVNRTILTDLDNGVTALWLAVGGADLPIGSVGAALNGVYLDLAPVILDAGPDVAEAADQLYAVLDARSDLDRSAVQLELGADPLGLLARTGDWFPGADLGTTVTLARKAILREEQVQAITVDATLVHEAGASDAEEVGFALAAGLEYVRALVADGVPVADALGQITFRFAATDAQFETIAKLRAARRTWARVAEVLGAPEAGAARQHVVTSRAMMTQRDPWVNMLRTTLAAFGAGVGGADTVTVLPFDVAIPGGQPGVTRDFAARVARNTQLLLLEEAHLGRVLDPAGGSWYVERLTAELGEAAWSFFQDVERGGGYVAAIRSGLVAERVEPDGSRRGVDGVAQRVQRLAVRGDLEAGVVAGLGQPSHRARRDIQRKHRSVAMVVGKEVDRLAVDRKRRRSGPNIEILDQCTSSAGGKFDQPEGDARSTFVGRALVPDADHPRTISRDRRFTEVRLRIVSQHPLRAGRGVDAQQFRPWKSRLLGHRPGRDHARPVRHDGELCLVQRPARSGSQVGRVRPGHGEQPHLVGPKIVIPESHRRGRVQHRTDLRLLACLATLLVIRAGQSLRRHHHEFALSGDAH